MATPFCLRVSLFALLIGIAAVSEASSTRYYVDANVSESGAGTSWESAFKTFDEAVGASAAGDEIWVAQGTYNLLSPVAVKNGLKIYGGFASGATALSDQNTTSHPTIVSGAALTSSMFVLSGISNSRLDGLTIQDADVNTSGAGVCCTNLDNTNIIANCTIAGNYSGNYIGYPVETVATGSGGGIFCQDASPIIQNCHIWKNKSFLNGAGIFIRRGSPQILGCTVSQNGGTTTTPNIPTYGGALDGGGICIQDATVSIFDSLIMSNQANSRGGGIACSGASNLTIDRCRIVSNAVFLYYSMTPGYGGGIWCQGNSPVITQCTIAANSMLAPGGQLGGYGGGICCDSASPTFVNCLIAGNYCQVPLMAANCGGGGIMAMNHASPTLTHCTIADNEAFSGGALCCQNESTPTLIGCMVASQISTAGAIREMDAGSDPRIWHTAFCDNGSDYYDYDLGQVFTGSNLIYLFELINPMYGTSNFLHGDFGGPDAAITLLRSNYSYNLYACQYRLVDPAANYTPGALAGKMIKVYTPKSVAGYMPQGGIKNLAYVIDNTTTSVLIAARAGLATATRYTKISYQFCDYHPGCGSPAIDGISDVNVYVDLENRARPVDIPGQGQSADTDYDLGAFETLGTEPPSVEVTTTTCPLDFETVGTGSSRTQSVAITNVGFSTLTFTGTGLAIGGASAADYAIVGTPDLSPLAPGQSRLIFIRFSPNFVSNLNTPKLAELRITTSDPNKPLLRYPLTGNALEEFNPNLVWVKFGDVIYEMGTADHPFNTLQEGLGAVADFGTVRLFTGQTSEACRITRPIRLDTYGGPARIGAN